MPWIALAAARKALGAAWGFWRELPGPVKAFILILLAAGVGVLWGEHDGNRRCARRIEASIESARQLDTSISAEAKARADQQVSAAQAREATIKGEVQGYVQELAKRTAAACGVGADADRLNDGLGVSDGPVQPPRAGAPAGREHRPDAGHVPQGKSER